MFSHFLTREKQIEQLLYIVKAYSSHLFRMLKPKINLALYLNLRTRNKISTNT